jgi:hypothetical protein
LLIVAAPGAPKMRLVTANIREDWEAARSAHDEFFASA